MTPDTSSPSTPAAVPRQTARDDRMRLGEVLVAAGVLDEEQVARCLAEQAARRPRPRIGRVVSELGLASERQVADALSQVLGLTLVDLSRCTIDPLAVRLLPRTAAERTGVLVLDRDGDVLIVAAHDPTNVLALDEVRAYTGVRELRVLVATESQVREHLLRLWTGEASGLDAEEFASSEPEETDADASAAWADAAPIVRLANMLLTDAVRSGASDVHVEPYAQGLRVRHRVDGVLRDTITVPRASAAALVSRFKILSSLDISERRLPQDGRFTIVVDGRKVDLRLSTLPSVHGEKLVARVLATSEAVPPLEELGLAPDQLHALRAAFEAPQGLVLITGPTGSGKTSTLYAGLGSVDAVARNVVTLEDPVEVRRDRVTQVQVNERNGMTFARGLRALLRQDPDVVLVGEIRDGETADLALKASLTGHLVLSTLHTTSAVGALTRLVDMGSPAYLVASALSCVVAQRLVRRPCAECAAPYQPSPATLRALGLDPARTDLSAARSGRGCASCGHTGYRGRRAVFEVVPVDAALREVLQAETSERALAAAVRAAGHADLRAAGAALAGAGGTTFEEVLRVLPRE